jgi:hypothetical protein
MVTFRVFAHFLARFHGSFAPSGYCTLLMFPYNHGHFASSTTPVMTFPFCCSSVTILTTACSKIMVTLRTVYSTLSAVIQPQHSRVLDVMLLLIDENHKVLCIQQVFLLLQVICYVEITKSDAVKCDVAIDSMLHTDMYISWLPSLWVLELVLLLCSFFFCLDSFSCTRCRYSWVAVILVMLFFRRGT